MKIKMTREKPVLPPAKIEMELTEKEAAYICGIIGHLATGKAAEIYEDSLVRSVFDIYLTKGEMADMSYGIHTNMYNILEAIRTGKTEASR